MQSFKFHRPTSIDEAVQILDEAEEGKILAGGQSLLPVMKLGMAAPSDVISLGAIDELRGIRSDNGRLVIGAAATHAEVHSSDVVQGTIPALADLAGGIGDPQVRNRGTLGGSVAHNDPAADYPGALIALDAEIKTNRRTITAQDFFTGMFETALDDNELIVEVSFAVPEKAAYRKFANPASRYAITGVMVARHAGGNRVAVVGAGENVFRASAMERALDASFEAKALDGLEISAANLSSDLQASADYRAHLVGVMARRAVAACR